VTAPLCKCGCNKPVERRSYETDRQWAKRKELGIFRDKCKKALSAAPKPPRPKPTLSPVSVNYGRGGGGGQVKPHRWSYPPYRRFVASYPCCHCTKMGAEPHHHQEPGEGCTGGKVGDEKCVPLCHVCHRDVHQYGRGVWELWGVDPVEVIAFMQQQWWLKFGTRPWLHAQR
jgi:hypothetical protein